MAKKTKGRVLEAERGTGISKEHAAPPPAVPGPWTAWTMPLPHGIHGSGQYPILAVANVHVTPGTGRVVLDRGASSVVGAGVAGDGNVPVIVDRALLRLAVERTGIADAAALVEFALRLLTEPDPSAEFAEQTRGTLPDLDLDI